MENYDHLTEVEEYPSSNFFFRCKSCKYEYINPYISDCNGFVQRDHKFCPSCGRLIVWKGDERGRKIS